VARETILHRVRTALGRAAGQDPEPAPPPRLRIPESGIDRRVSGFCAALESLAGSATVAHGAEEARQTVAALIAGHTAVASNAPFLAELGVPSLPGVQCGIFDRDELKRACAAADFGITSADYALADTGSLVMISSREEPRLISLLPPRHIAVVPRERILANLDELFTLIPLPSQHSSSLVLITGPSRTADIEQILVRGVHGPGHVHAIIL